ncbi:unnamed protein product [Blepharisma stoltei]|uniref:Uncharacterized protein n=1 Tax=Blepharisma stoltei TaxID=1481888 RepID=A0AAU9K139_9CILI|nr:unnamed protein product [Blepharisma stoltei]
MNRGSFRAQPPSNQGRHVQIITNFFRLSNTPSANVGLYSIDYSPNVDDNNRSLQSKLIKSAKLDIEAQIGEIVKSGNNIAGLRIRTEPFTVFAMGFEKKQYTLVIRLAGTVGLDHPPSYRMYCNNILKMMMLKDLKYIQMTRLPVFYDKSNIANVPQYQLSVYRGYSASFSHNSDQMLLTIDFSSKIVRDMTALDMMLEIRNSNQQNLKQAFERQMKDTWVMTNYGNLKTYRIEGFDFTQNPSSSFRGKDGPITYIEYYKRNYKIDIKDKKQPLIQTSINRGQKVIFLIPELCKLTGIPERMKKNYNVMRELAQYNKPEPQERLSSIQDLSAELTGEKVQGTCEKYSLSINPAPITMEATLLPMEKIRLFNQEIYPNDQAQFNIRGKILSSVNIENWVVLSTQNDSNMRNELIKSLKRSAQSFGIEIESPAVVTYNQNNLKNVIEGLNARGNEDLQVAVILLPRSWSYKYHEIKAAACLNSGVVTQVVLVETLNNQKRFEQIVQKIMLQIAAKTGSDLWGVTPAQNVARRSMIIGIDVFHDTINRQNSVLGFIASLNDQFTKYYNTVKIHPSGKEIANSLGSCLGDALTAYYENTKRSYLPDHIIIYRDGVGDTMFDAVRLNEIEGMKEAIRNFQGYIPNLTYIIVNKRISAKLFTQVRGEIKSAQPGTLVNSVIVPDQNSFYLVAHSSGQGMAVPALYRVIYNDSQTSVTTFARLAFKLCYMYYNWTGGIKVPAPTMMAHKLAYIVGQSIHHDYLESLKTSSFFY